MHGQIRMPAGPRLQRLSTGKLRTLTAVALSCSSTPLVCLKRPLQAVMLSHAPLCIWTCMRSQGGDSAPVKAKAAAATASSSSGLSFGLLIPVLLILAAIFFQFYLNK